MRIRTKEKGEIKMLRAAIASNDGVSVNEHFGKAEEFYIYEIEYGVPFFLEKRKTRKYSQGKETHSYNRNRFEDVYKSIMDCDFIVVNKIGAKPKEELRARGVGSFISDKKIKSLIFNNIKKTNGE
jgi:predicted Fe-Mo cluster-binding NifX family protein